MSEDETNQFVKVLAQKLADEKALCPPERKSKEAREWLNLVVTVLAALAALAGPVCWYAVSQHIDLTATTIESHAKDTYVDKPTYTTDKNQLWTKVGQVDTHLDDVDGRENSDKAAEDLKIEALQLKSGGAVSSMTASNIYNPKE